MKAANRAEKQMNDQRMERWNDGRGTRAYLKRARKRARRRLDRAIVSESI